MFGLQFKELRTGPPEDPDGQSSGRHPARMERHVPFFEPLAWFVRTKPGREIMIISLADYVSKEYELHEK